MKYGEICWYPEAKCAFLCQKNKNLQLHYDSLRRNENKWVNQNLIKNTRNET